MLYSFTHLRGFAIRARDGDLGTVDDVFFDERSTRLRYIVVDTGGWLSAKKVLLAPAAVRNVDDGGQVLAVDLTRKQVEDSPGVDSDRPVSRQEELRIHQHFGWQPYWMFAPEAGLSAPFWGGVYAPPLDAGPERAEEEVAARRAEEQEEGDPNLRSAREVRGYTVAAEDGDVGTIDDFLIDDGTWAIAYLVVDTGSWFSSRPVIVAPTGCARSTGPARRSRSTSPGTRSGAARPTTCR